MHIFDEDLEWVKEIDFIDWNRLKDKTLFVTGATGLIGAAVINVLDYINEWQKLGIHILVLVRDEHRARERFSNILDHEMVQLIVGCVEELPVLTQKIDYIIHAASETSSKEFMHHAVETLITTMNGTQNILKLAKEKHIQSLVYLSSMEVYGYPLKGHVVIEKEIGKFSPLNLRNSYPISKIAAEAMCCAYANEYDVPAKIIRLTQTFGPGLKYNDERIFAYLGRCVKEKKNIVLRTTGETERCYLYTIDAVTAILAVLLNGVKGTAYNAADESTYCSISEMAEKIAKENGIGVEYDIQPTSVNGFLETLYMHLDTTALKQLGWKPVGKYSIEEIFKKMVDGMYEA